MSCQSFKYGVESRFGVEPAVECDGQERQMVVGIAPYSLFEMLHPVAVDEVGKTFPFILIDQLRGLMRRDAQLPRQLRQVQFGV